MSAVARYQSACQLYYYWNESSTHCFTLASMYILRWKHTRRIFKWYAHVDVDLVAGVQSRAVWMCAVCACLCEYIACVRVWLCDRFTLGLMIGFYFVGWWFYSFLYLFGCCVSLHFTRNLYIQILLIRWRSGTGTHQPKTNIEYVKIRKEPTIPAATYTATMLIFYSILISFVISLFSVLLSLVALIPVQNHKLFIFYPALLLLLLLF